VRHVSLSDLQSSIQDRTAFNSLNDYLTICTTFLRFINKSRPTRIISPSHPNYIFYQYEKEYEHKITRPLNVDLFFEITSKFEEAYERCVSVLDDLRVHQEAASKRKGYKQYLGSNEINKVVYTIQQAIGAIGDSFDNPNQSRKRVGQLFESFVKLIIQEVGLECESRTIKIPIPGPSDFEMSYELDLVFSRNKAIITSETKYIHPSEVVGSVKTTSKDRIDKVFLDKYLLTKFLKREIPVVAIFLHDVQRARRGKSIFGINSTFKTNHFLGYTVALTKLDGVYYVDPRPEMVRNDHLRKYIQDFQQFLLTDLWELSNR